MKLIELHMLQSFPVTCLNRDDVGAPKSGVFGGCNRARVSSQSWKRAIRLMLRENPENGKFFQGRRTRYFVTGIADELENTHGMKKKEAEALAKAIGSALFSPKEVGKNGDFQTKTLFYFSPKERENILKAALTAQKAKGDVAAAVKVQKGKAKVKDFADIALCARMVANDPSLTLEGAAMFSHSLSTHKVGNEIDFFTAVDDEQPQDELGGGHLGVLEFNASCYYRYVGVNVDLLKDKDHLGHLTPDELKVILGTFIRSCIMAVPGARRWSMFGHTLPSYVLGLQRVGQPLCLANAFERPVRPSRDGFVEPSIKAILSHKDDIFGTFGLPIDVDVAIPDVTLDDFVKELLSGI